MEGGDAHPSPRRFPEIAEMIRTYARPATLDEALDLLAAPDAAVLAGGTDLNGDTSGAPATAVDLQNLGLAGVNSDGEGLHIGAMTTLQALADADTAPPLIRDLAHREAPNTIRNAATVGGTIGSSDPESELLAGLLVFDASVTLAGKGGSTDVTLDRLLEDPTLLEGSIITSVTVATEGAGAAARTGRTPMDRPIVMVAGRSTPDGTLHLAATGVASRPVPLDPSDLTDLQPPGDFRGSPEYRRHLAEVLSRRVVDELKGGSS